MHEIVRQYIENKKAEAREKYNKEKSKKLFELGIYEKEFPADPENFDYTEYNYSFYDKSTQTYKRYKRVPIEVTDDEYEEILKHTDNGRYNESNPVSKALCYIAVSIYVIGVIAGFFYIEYAFMMTLLVWLASFVSGTTMLGFSEIVKLLHEIKSKIKQ